MNRVTIFGKFLTAGILQLWKGWWYGNECHWLLFMWPGIQKGIRFSKTVSVKICMHQPFHIFHVAIGICTFYAVSDRLWMLRNFLHVILEMLYRFRVLFSISGHMIVVEYCWFLWRHIALTNEFWSTLLAKVVVGVLDELSVLFVLWNLTDIQEWGWFHLQMNLNPRIAALYLEILPVFQRKGPTIDMTFPRKARFFSSICRWACRHLY